MQSCRHIGFVVAAVLASSTLAPVSADAIVVDDDGGAGVDHTTIVDALAAAIDGDLILVKDGAYSGFAVGDLTVTITADAGATVSVTSGVTVSGLSSTRSVALYGLDIDANFGGIGMILSNNDGPIHIERCVIAGSGVAVFQINHGVQMFNCDAVTFVECGIGVGFDAGAYAGLTTSSSTVCLYECVISAGDAFIDQVPGAAGCQVSSGFLFASGTTFFGGRGGDGIVQAPFMICTDGSDGGAGLLVTGGADARVLDCTFIGGPGGAAGDAGCSPGATGPGISGVTTSYAVPAHTYDIPSPVREGDVAAFTINGEPGELVWIFFGVEQDPTFSNKLKGCLSPPGDALLLFIGTLPASGQFVLPASVPIFAGSDCFQLWEQVLYWNSPTKFKLSNPRLSVILDETL